MAGSHAPLGVFEDDLDERPVGGVDNVEGDLDGGLGRRWLVGHGVVLEHLVGNVVVLDELERRGGVRPDRVDELDGAGDIDVAIVVGSLRVGASGAGSEVQPERPPLIAPPGPLSFLSSSFNSATARHRAVVGAVANPCHGAWIYRLPRHLIWGTAPVRRPPLLSFTRSPRLPCGGAPPAAAAPRGGKRNGDTNGFV
ncbi:hypothetical protein B296_00020739 [Ensete ventricosum]|uniref:Uncharacterized protein n=1 Tax=Ensete ventricosum TaxID=4639 RepID=A0A427B0R4_ENSVE|nr:hypothetical protein B296_00020739 [Ensete ventricosum]